MPLVQRLGFIAFNVVDLDAMVADQERIVGARVVERTENRAIMTSNRRHGELILYRARANAIRGIGLEARDAAAVDEVHSRARAAGLRVVSTRPSLEFIEKSVTFLSSEGHVFEVHTAVPEDQPRWYPGTGIHPNTLDHVNLQAADPKVLAEELEAATGMLLTQRTPGYEATWLRAADRRHHTIGILMAPRRGLHHYSWEFNAFDDFKRLGDVLATSDRRLIWGPGRHGGGDNLFSYYYDAAGFIAECTAEMEIITDDAMEARVVDAGPGFENPQVVNLWGAPPPAAFLAHHSEFAEYSDPAGSEAA